ncbi:MAG: hypothetical protein NTV45_04125 [Firmicutes bacterium]|nr:hypothetical protein [Bacillota bacterium]
MKRDYINRKPVYVFNQGGTNHETQRDNMTFLTIKIGFAGMIALLTMCLILFCIMAFS